MTGAIDTSSATDDATSNHHSSHRELLTLVDTPLVAPGEVDAIIVPTARNVVQLQQAIELAAKLRCKLVTLHSRHSSAAKAQSLAYTNCVDIVAVDMRSVPNGLLPDFRTTTLLAGTPFARGTDTSSKRNLGLLLARIAGWDRVVFLDDDITIPDPQHLTDAVRLLDKFDGVGLTLGGFPDNSVVCHAHRDTGGFQDTFIGGGALAVNPTSCDSFFPDVYNEDWFFLLDDAMRIRPIARSAGIALQKPYDPFANDRRARTEEFGDMLAEGVFWLLDQGKRVEDAGYGYWRRFLEKRRKFITDVLGRVDDTGLPSADRARMKSALLAARGRCSIIKPELCMDYLQAWREDRRTWSTFLSQDDRAFTGHPRSEFDEMVSQLILERRAQPKAFTSTVHSSTVSRRVPSVPQFR